MPPLTPLASWLVIGYAFVVCLVVAVVCVQLVALVVEHIGGRTWILRTRAK